MNKNLEFLRALLQLDSDESRAYFTFTFLQNGTIDLLPSEVLKNVEIFCKSNKYLDAARFAKLAKCKELANDCYDLAIIHFEKLGKIANAADIAKEAGMLGRAMTNYAKAGNTLQAAHIAEEVLLKEKAAAFFEQAKKPLEAARIYEELGQQEKASSLYEKAGQTFDAFRTSRDAGKYEQAANIWDKAGKPEAGAHHAKKHGLVQLADKLYEKAINKLVDAQNPTVEDYNNAAFLAKEAGWNNRAFEFYERAIRAAGSKEERERMFGQAIRLCCETNQPQKAQAYKSLEALFK